MSASTKFYTLHAMVNAVVHDVSSECSPHPAEHALILEPDFAWEADELDAQHYLAIDLTKPCEADAVVWIHRDVEILTPSPYPSPSPSPLPWGVYADIYYSNDGSIYTKATLTVDPGINDLLLKISEFSIGAAQRYWKIIFRSTDDPSYYMPEDTRVSAVWVSRKHKIDAGPTWPMNDTTVLPGKSFNMAYGDIAGVGFSVNEQIRFSRTYALNDTDYAVMLDMLAETNGGETLVVMQERDENPMLVRVESAVSVQNFAIGWQTMMLTFVQVPMVGRDELY